MGAICGPILDPLNFSNSLVLTALIFVGSQRTRQFSVAASARAFLLEMQQARVACHVLLAKSGYSQQPAVVSLRKNWVCVKKKQAPGP